MLEKKPICRHSFDCENYSEPICPNVLNGCLRCNIINSKEKADSLERR